MQEQPASFVAVPGTHVDGPGSFLSQETQLISLGINENFPLKDERFLRLATFNIHFFRDADDQNENDDRVYSDIVALDPDVIVLQEVPYTLTETVCELVDQKMASLGFDHVLRCNGEQFLELGNVIYSKLPLTETVSRKLNTQTRCFVSGVVEWAGGSKLRVTGSHLDAYRESHRMSEIIELASFHEDQTEGHVVMADFNAWYSSNVLQYMRSFGFVDSFDAAGWERPAYTCWTGTAIDFILLCPVAREKWHVAGSYVYHTTTSDHLPIIVDLDPKI